MNFNKIIKFLVSIIICQLAGVIGAVFTTPEINGWYKSLNKPSFNPPSWVFGPAWTMLFILMGISLYIVWSKKISFRNILIFAIQLAINILWSVVFFGMHSPSAAFFVLLLLWVAILFTIINFYKVSKIAAWLLVPYILWVSFAGILNLAIFLLN